MINNSEDILQKAALRVLERRARILQQRQRYLANRRLARAEARLHQAEQLGYYPPRRKKALTRKEKILQSEAALAKTALEAIRDGTMPAPIAPAPTQPRGSAMAVDDLPDPDRAPMRFIEFRALRRRLGLTHELLAMQLDSRARPVTRAKVGFWERGRTVIPPDVAATMRFMLTCKLANKPWWRFD